MASSQFKSTVNEYLYGLSEAVKQRLYESPATCLAIFRLLPSLAKFYIMSVLFNETYLTRKELYRWIKPDDRKYGIEAIEKLLKLQLLKKTRDQKHNQLFYYLNPQFGKSFRNALTGGPSMNSFGVPCDTVDKHKIDINFLDKHTTKKWESILHYMVGTQLNEIPSAGVLSLLKHSGLMEGSINGMRITNEGFQFLLQDVNTQIWTLLLQYLQMASDLNMDEVDVLNFIFMLGSLEFGKDYSSATLSPTQLQMLDDLRDYGLVYQRNSKSRRFYPTRLATTLTSDPSAVRTALTVIDQSIEHGKNGSIITSTGISDNDSTFFTSADQGFIIIETNFKLYAYTDSPLQIAILNLFVHLRARFQDMVTGQITRESIRNALYNGITADQIITYLEVHAHEQMLKAVSTKDEDNNNSKLKKRNEARGRSIIPPTVIDQIKLWQLELDRIKPTDGYLFHYFANDKEYQTAASYARELDVLLWENQRDRKFFVTKEGSSQVADYANRKSSKR